MLYFIFSLLLSMQTYASDTPIMGQNIKPQQISNLTALKTHKKSISFNPLSIIDFLGYHVWSEQDDINEAIFDSVGSHSLDFDLFRFDIQLLEDGFFTFSVQPELRTSRKIFLNNFPGSDSSAPKSQFIVANQLKLHVQPEIAYDDGTTEVEVRLADAGVVLQHYSQTDSSETDFNKNLHFLKPQEKSFSQSKNFFKKIAKRGKSFFLQIEKAFRNSANKISDSDRTKLFFNEVLAPLKLSHQLNKITYKTIQRPEIKVGDIISQQIYSSLGPEVRAGINPLKVFVSREYAQVYQKTVIKDENNIVRVKYTTSLSKNFQIGGETEFDFRIILDGDFSPIKIKKTRSNFYTLEWLYEFDLNQPQAQTAFDHIFDHIVPNFALLDRSQGVTYLNHNRTESHRPQKTSNLRADFGFNRHSARKSQSFNRVYNTDAFGIIHVDDIATAEKTRKHKSSLLFRESELIVSGMKYIHKNPDFQSDIQSQALNFYLHFNDRVSRTNEYKKYLKLISDILNLQNRPSKNPIAEALNSLEARAFDNKSQQKIYFNMNLTQNGLKSLFKVNEEQLIPVVSKLILGDVVWNTKSDIINWRHEMRSSKCSGSRVELYYQKPYIDCHWLANRALMLIKYFNKIKNSDSFTRAQLFEKLYSKSGLGTHIPALIIRLVTFDRTLSELIAQRDIKLSLIADGSDLENVIVAKENYFDFIAPHDPIGNFEANINSNDPNVIIHSETFIENTDSNSTQFILKFVTLRELESSDLLLGTISKKRFLRKNKEVFKLKTKDLMPTYKPHPVSPTYTYVVSWKLPKSSLDSNESYALRFWGYNKNSGNKTTESQNQLFVTPKIKRK